MGKTRGPIVHNLVQLAVEELRSFKPGHCATCSELSETLKQALLCSLLCSTWNHLFSAGSMQKQAATAETALLHALNELRDHHRDAHSIGRSTASWAGEPARV